MVRIDRQAAEARIALNSVLDVRQVRHVHETLTPLVDDSAPLCIDGSQVTRVDTAALQLLAAFCRCVRTRARSFRWHSPSDELARAAALLDLEHELGLRE